VNEETLAHWGCRAKNKQSVIEQLTDFFSKFHEHGETDGIWFMSAFGA